MDVHLILSRLNREHVGAESPIEIRMATKLLIALTGARATFVKPVRICVGAAPPIRTPIVTASQIASTSASSTRERRPLAYVDATSQT